MDATLARMMPGITRMIRMDHSHVLVTFHKYRPDSPLEMKRGIVDTICTALEIHAQLEEEIFYPALREVSPEDPDLAKSQPEHDRMRELIGELRARQPGEPDYDMYFLDLMREVIHHVADEETRLLPLAEQRLADRLGEMGAQMTRRRMELTLPRAGEIAVSTLKALPMSTLVTATGLMLAGIVVVNRLMSPRYAG